MESSFQRSVFPAIARADDGESSMRLAETSRMRFSASRKTDVISPIARDSLFGLRPVKKWIGWPGSCARSAENAWKVRRSVAPTAAAIMPVFLKIRMETKWRLLQGKPDYSGLAACIRLPCPAACGVIASTCRAIGFLRELPSHDESKSTNRLRRH